MKNDRLHEDIDRLLRLLVQLEDEPSNTIREQIKKDVLRKLHNNEGYGVLDRTLSLLERER
jgi:hypothetical protein